MNTQEYIKTLFKDYEESAGLADFMEELQSNLDARIASLQKKGLDEAAAFEKATAELGDISALADEISRKKRREVFEERYMDIRHYMKGPRIAAYLVFGLIFLFGILVALISYFGVNAGAADTAFLPPETLSSYWIQPEGMREDLSALFAILLVFVSVSIGGLTFLGLTQETSSLYPMKTKRALLYTLGVFLILFGILLFPLIYFGAGTKDGLVGGIASLLPFSLSGIGILAFLLLTEKEPRNKPWVLAHISDEAKKTQELWSDPVTAARFGTLSGAVWIFALGIFFVLGFAFGFKFSWLAFVFATAFQLLIQSFMYKREEK
jgi:hypothetical protein